MSFKSAAVIDTEIGVQQVKLLEITSPCATLCYEQLGEFLREGGRQRDVLIAKDKLFLK
jgi:hypothetical protein